MNKLTRLTALLLAMLMMFSTFATAETAYQVGGMTVENWQGIVDSAADKLFTIDEGDSGKVITPPATVTPAPGAFYPYTDGVSVDLGAAAVEDPLQITASGVAVLKNAEAGQWQMQYGNTWINITGATDSELWATSAMMNGMSVANFRKAFGERNAETGEYASYTNVATVEIVAEVASSSFFMMSRAAEDEGAVTPTPAPVTAANDVMTIEDANPDLSKYHIFIRYVFGTSSQKAGNQAAEPYHAEVSTNKQNFSATVKHPNVTGYAPDYAAAYVKNKDDATATEALPGWAVASQDYITITNAALSGDVNIYVPYKPAMNTFDVYYWEELVEYTTDNYGETVKYEPVDKIENIEGLTEDPVKNSYPAGAATQYYATLRNAAANSGFKALMYDEDIDIAADGSTAVNVYYQRLYYLMTFDLGGGYGVNPIYTKHGAKVEIDGEAQRPGYQFMGWTEDPNATEYTEGQTFATIPAEMPIGGKQYYAVWKAKPVAYTVVYWRENANDNNYSFWGSQKFDAQNEMVLAGSTLNYDASKHAIPSSITTVTINGDTVNESNYFTFNTALTDKDVVVEGDGTTILNVYYYRKTYTVYFDANGTMTGACVIEPHNHNDGTCTQDLICHIHGEDCVKTLTCTIEAGHVHSAEECGTILKCGETVHTTHTRACYEGTANSPTADPRGTEPSNPVEGQVHVGRDSNYQSYRKYVYTNGAWYRLDDNINVQNGDILTPGCHQHSESCYTFNCNKVEHKHVESCYSYTCPEADHVHTSACYRPCTKPVHSHSGNCTNASGNSNVLYVITAKYNQDINWPAFDGIAYWTGNSAYNSEDLTQSSKVVTLTHDYANANTMTMQAHTGQVSHALNYMFESFDTESGEDTYKRRAYNGVYYDRSERYSQIAYYYAQTSWSYKVIDGFTKAQSSGSASVATNPYPDLDADNIIFLYYKRNRWTLSFYNHSSDSIPQLSNDQVMFDQPLDGYVIDGKNLNTYLPADNYYPKDLEAGAYHFDGWYTTPECFDGTEFDPETAFMPNGDLNVYGKWSPYTYSVFVYNHAADAEKALAELETTPDTVTTSATPIYYWINQVEHGEPTSSAFSYQNSWYDPDKNEYVQPTPERQGYVFKLWYYYDENGDPQPFSFGQTPITRDTVVFAGWEANAIADYTIYYVVSDGIDDDNVPVAPEHYLNKDNWVADPLTDSGLAGAYITEYAKLPKRDGYFPLKGSHSFFLEVEAEENVYVFEYRPVDNMPYVVHYVTATQPETGNYEEIQLVVDGVEGTYYKLIASKTVNPNTKAVVTENYESIGGSYVPDAFQKRLYIEAGMPEDKRAIVFIYTKDESKTTLKVNHYLVHADGTVVDTPYDYAYQIVDLEYSDTLETMDIPNYTYDATRTTRQDGDGQAQPIGNLTITIAEGSPEVTVNLYYTENTVTINYIAVGPDGATGFGSVSPETEVKTIGVLTGAPAGSTATVGQYYNFVGWFSDEDCTQKVPASWVDENNKIIPQKVKDLNVSATYYAKFEEKEAEIEYIAVGPDGVTDFGTVALNGSNEAGKTQTGETVPVKTGVATGATAAPYDSTFKFVGWYTKNEREEYVKIDGAAANYIPNKGGDAWPELSTYYAIFDYDVGHLSITKTVVNTTTDFTPTQTAFTFTVKLTGVTGDVKYWIGETEYTATKIKDGEYTLTLANGQMAMIKNILNGTKYTVTETPVTGYTTTYLKNEKKVEGYEVSGTIIPGATVNETFINTYAVGSLELTKTVEGTVTDVYPSNFGFTLTLSDAAALANCKIQINDGTVNAMPQDGKFTLEHGQKAIITGIPQGVTYTVTEDAQVNGKNVADYFTVTAVGEKVNGNVVTGMIAVDTTDKADFTNTAKTGSLTIEKSATGGNAGDTFLFDVTGPNNYKTTVVLTAGKEITLTELPFGEYFVKENTAWSWRYKTDDSEESAVISPGQNGNVEISNTIDNEKWLDDETTVVNKFTKTN